MAFAFSWWGKQEQSQHYEREGNQTLVYENDTGLFLVNGREREGKADVFAVTFISSYSSLHRCSISFTCSVFLLSPKVFHLCSLFLCNLKANVER